MVPLCVDVDMVPTEYDSVKLDMHLNQHYYNQILVYLVEEILLFFWLMLILLLFYYNRLFLIFGLAGIGVIGWYMIQLIGWYMYPPATIIPIVIIFGYLGLGDNHTMFFEVLTSDNVIIQVPLLLFLQLEFFTTWGADAGIQ